MNSDSAGKIFLCLRPTCPLPPACPLNIIYLPKSLLSSLPDLEDFFGALRDSISEGGLVYKRDLPPGCFLF